MLIPHSHEKIILILKIFLCMNLISCSSIETVHRGSEAESKSVEQIMQTPNPPSNTTNSEVKKVAELAEKSNQTQAAISHDSNEPTKNNVPVYKIPKAVDWETSLRWLKNGNTRFLKGWKRADKAGLQKFLQSVVAAQPHAIIISDIDHRIIPHFIFDQQFGEILSYRSPGPRLTSVDLVSIEYAVQKWGTRHIVVLGNSDCLFAKNCMDTSLQVATELKDKSDLIKNLNQMKEIHITEAFLDLKKGTVNFK